MKKPDPFLFTEHSPRFEIIPIVVAAVILNVGGRFVADQGEITFIWLDSVGTVSASLILGPWWGATAGLLSNAVIGHFNETFLKYGLATIAQAVVWGYVGRTRPFRQRLLAPRDEAHPFAVGRTLMLVALSVGALTGLITASIKTVILVQSGGDVRSVAQNLTGLYGAPGYPDPCAPFRSLLWYSLGDGIRHATQSVIGGWLALVIVRNALPLAHARRLQPPPLGLLVSRGSVSVFLMVAVCYQAVLLVETWDSDLYEHHGVVTFLLSQLASPLVLGGVVLMYGVYCTEDKTLAKMRRWKAERERHYRAVARSIVPADAPGAAVKTGIFTDVHVIVAIIMLLLGWREAVVEGWFGSDTGTVTGLIYLLLFFGMAAYYFGRRRDFAGRFAACLAAIQDLSSRGRAKRTRRKRLDAIGSLIAYALAEPMKYPLHEILRSDERTGIIAVGAWRKAEGDRTRGSVASFRVHVLEPGEPHTPGQFAAAVGGVADDAVDGVILVALGSYDDACAAAVAANLGGTKKLLTLLSPDDLEEVAHRRVSRSGAMGVLQRGQLRLLRLAEAQGRP